LVNKFENKGEQSAKKDEIKENATLPYKKLLTKRKKSYIIIMNFYCLCGRCDKA
jgi:hypothetical protein